MDPTFDGEALAWLPVARLGEYKIFLAFFAEELPNLSREIKRFVTRG